MLLESGACDKHLSFRQCWLVEMGHRRHLLRRVRWKPRWHFNTVGKSCVRQDASLRQTEASRSDTAIPVRTPNGWTFGDRFKELATRAFDNTDRFVNIQRRNRTRSYRFDDQLDGRSMVASKGLATRAFDNTNPFGKHPASELHGRLLRERLAFAMIHRKMRPKLGWWPLPHKPDRTKPCTGARECG